LEKFEMKKSLVAIATLASTAAFAQSSVSLYGVADAWVGSSKSDVAVAAPTPATAPAVLAVGERQTLLGSGGLNGSRWGLRGSEDLGGGLKANFTLEQGFAIDTAAAATSGLQFSRQAYVGASGGFGEVRLGRQYSAYDELRGATNNTFDSAFAITGYVWGAHKDNAATPNTLYGGDYNSRIDNQIYYATPNMSGFSAAIGYGLGENKAAGLKATDTLSLHGKYANGPLLVGLAYQDQKLAITGSNKYTLLAGSYNLGVAKIMAGVNQGKRPAGASTEKDTEFQLGVDFPLGATTIALGYAYAKVKNDLTGGTAKANGFSAAATYDLSKRTAMYVGMNTGKVKEDIAQTGGVVRGDLGKTQLFAVGVRHKF
jgi:predicted porin